MNQKVKHVKKYRGYEICEDKTQFSQYINL